MSVKTAMLAGAATGYLASKPQTIQPGSYHSSCKIDGDCVGWSCIDGRCELSPEGGTCGIDKNCSGSYNDTSCVNNKCLKPQPLNGECNSDKHCESRLYCNDNKCANLYKIGESCSKENDYCDWGLVCGDNNTCIQRPPPDMTMFYILFAIIGVVLLILAIYAIYHFFFRKD